MHIIWSAKIINKLTNRESLTIIDRFVGFALCLFQECPPPGPSISIPTFCIYLQSLTTRSPISQLSRCLLKGE
jgi:hypothetical protein